MQRVKLWNTEAFPKHYDLAGVEMFFKLRPCAPLIRRCIDCDIFINFSFDKLIFSFLQVFRDLERLLTASVGHLTCAVYCKIGQCLETMRVSQLHV